MCEILLRVVDKVNAADLYADIKCLKRGDVVCVVDDGWDWGASELASVEWRIIKFPNIARSTVENFLGPELRQSPDDDERLLRRRAFMLDLNSPLLPSAFKAWLDDDSRTQPTRTVNLTAQQIASLKLAKTRLAGV